MWAEISLGCECKSRNQVRNNNIVESLLGADLPKIFVRRSFCYLCNEIAFALRLRKILMVLKSFLNAARLQHDQYA